MKSLNENGALRGGYSKVTGEDMTRGANSHEKPTHSFDADDFLSRWDKIKPKLGTMDQTVDTSHLIVRGLD